MKILITHATKTKCDFGTNRNFKDRGWVKSIYHPETFTKGTYWTPDVDLNITSHFEIDGEQTLFFGDEYLV